MNLTGGLHWHWRAWRAGARWDSASSDIENWLLSHTLESDHLILIGASAGWMMSDAWLSRFKTVDTWDIDPLAAMLFKWRHARVLRQQGVHLQCHTSDAITLLPQLLNEHPKAIFFFDNVLGQIRFQTHTIAQAEKRLQAITHTLRGRTWGSVHDRMSGPVERAWMNTPMPGAHTVISGDKNEGTQTQQWLGQLGAKSPWLDHLTGGIFSPGTAITNIAWPMQAAYWHWLQAGWVRA
jgi:hypothetical protein